MASIGARHPIPSAILNSSIAASRSGTMKPTWKNEVWMAARDTSAAEEAQQGSVGLLGERPADVVGAVLDRHDSNVVVQRLEAPCRVLEGKDPVLGAVHDEGRDVDLLDVRPEVGEPCVDACVT